MPSIKPSNPVINWGNPITKGLVFDLPISTPGSINVKTGGANYNGAITGATYETKELGNTLKFNGGSTTDKVRFTSYPTTEVRSIQVIARWNALDATPRRIWDIDAQGDGSWAASDNRLNIQVSWTSVNGVWGATFSTTNEWVNIIYTYDGTSTSNDALIYINGKDAGATETGTPSGTIKLTASTFDIGNRFDSTRAFNGNIALYRRWNNRILTPTEVKQLYIDPWCIYQKPRFRMGYQNVSAAIKDFISFGMIPFGR